MFPDALKEVLQSLDASSNALFGYEDISRWPQGALNALVGAGLLERASDATSVICDECGEETCYRPVEVEPSEDGAVRLFMVCPARTYIGRVWLEPQRVFQWQPTAEGLASILAKKLSALGGVEPIVPERLWQLGKVTSKAGRADAFLARGIRWRDSSERILVNPRLQECSRYLLLTVCDSHDTVPLGKAAVSLSRVLTLGEDGLTLDREIIEEELAKRPGRPSPRGSRFPTPVGTPWEQVKIVILKDGDEAVVTAGGVTESVKPAQMGLAYTSNPSKLTKLWCLLIKLSRHGRIDFRNKLASRETTKQIERLSTKLQAYFGIEDAPFKPYHVAKGYEPRFQIRHI